MTIADVIAHHGLVENADAFDATVEAWEEAGLDAAEVEEWLNARCFSPDAARDMAHAGITPQMAQLRTGAGAGRYVDTVAFKVAAGDLEVEAARDLLGAG
jgi:hypothetical protein